MRASHGPASRTSAAAVTGGFPRNSATAGRRGVRLRNWAVPLRVTGTDGRGEVPVTDVHGQCSGHGRHGQSPVTDGHGPCRVTDMTTDEQGCVGRAARPERLPLCTPIPVRSVTAPSVLSVTLFSLTAVNIRRMRSADLRRPPLRSRCPQSLSTLAAPAVTFPLRVSANRQHLEDSTGAPFLVVGDTAWSLVAQLSNETDIERYLDDRAVRGVQRDHRQSARAQFASHAPATVGGVQPFAAGRMFQHPERRSTSTSLIARSPRRGAAASRSGCVRRIWDGTAATKGSSRRSMPRGRMRCATTAGSWVSVSKISQHRLDAWRRLRVSAVASLARRCARRGIARWRRPRS